jgi:CheY-like chemotaxis protein
LTALLGYADLLRDSSLSLSTRDKYLAVVRRNGEHLLELINDILDLTKIEAGRLALDVQRCSMVSVVADIASTMRARAEQRGIRLTVDYPGDVPETILTDRARLRQALMNLAGNAVKFTEQGEVRIVTTFLPAWRNGTPAVKFEIVDTGIGIREEVLAGLFQPFVQADTTTARRFGGTGLGLAISRHIAELLGGELNATSVWGQGSTFTLIVPTGDLGGVRMLPHPTEVPQEADVAPWQPICENLKGVRILLAEDGFDNQELIGLVLRKAGAEVAIAQNGRVAVEMAQSDSFDLVLMDVNMPEMDGYQATRLLREQGYRKPILALTANAMSGDRERSLEAGCDDHAAKPIDWAHLLHLISVHVGAPVPEGRDAPPPPPEASGDADEVVVSEYESDPLMAKILPGFIERLPGQVDAMRESLACEAYEDLQHLAHKLKGSGGSYGYESLTEASRTLEAAAKARDAGAAAAGLGKLAALCAAIRRGHAASASSIEEIRLRAGDETSERLPVSAGPTPPDWPPPPT